MRICGDPGGPPEPHTPLAPRARGADIVRAMPAMVRASIDAARGPGPRAKTAAAAGRKQMRARRPRTLGTPSRGGAPRSIKASTVNAETADEAQVGADKIGDRDDDDTKKEDKEEEQGDVATAKFNWEWQWYPMLVDDLTDKSRPHKATLLGVNIVLWHDGEHWHAANDVCPHRLAPMSEGRVEKDGTLLCSYHGWRFDGDGRCVAIPQATPEQEARALANDRSCLPGARACQVVHNVVWIWGESEGGADAMLRAAATPARTFAELLPGGEGIAAGWSMRDLPYGWEYFMENGAQLSFLPPWLAVRSEQLTHATYPHHHLQ